MAVLWLSMTGPLAWFPRWCWSRFCDFCDERAARAESNFTRLQPLDDDEIRGLTGWGDDAEIPAFRAGWLWFREHVHDPIGVHPGEAIGRVHGLPHWGPSERRAFERGASAAQAVYDKLWGPAHPSG